MQRRAMHQGCAQLLCELLPVYEHLREATKELPDAEHMAQWREGIRRLGDQWDGVLKKFKISRIETVGKPFDPLVHEAVQSHGGGADVVVEELSGGYTLDDQLLYPAKVAVGDIDASSVTEEEKT
jgi:molecular chaperone GrpE